MIDTTLIYLRNSIRLLGLLMLVLGLGLILYQCGSMFWTGRVSDWVLHGLVPIPHWLHYAPSLVQSLCGWPWVVLEVVPLPLVCLVGGILALHV